MASLNNTINVKADDVEVDSILKIPILSAVDRSYGGSRGDICTGLEDSRLYIHNGIEYVPVSDDTPIITSHNSMLNLQGGNATERYHLSQADVDKVIALRTDIQDQIDAKFDKTGGNTTGYISILPGVTIGKKLAIYEQVAGVNNTLYHGFSSDFYTFGFNLVSTDSSYRFLVPDGSGVPIEKARISGTGLFNSSALTASRALISNSSKDIVTSSASSNDLSLLQGIYVNNTTPTVKDQLEAKLGNTGSVSIATPSLASFTFNTNGNRPMLTMTATGTNNKLAIDVSDSTGRTAFKSNTTTNMLFSTDGNIDFPVGIHLSNTLDITPNTVPITNSARKVISSTTTSNDLSLLQGIYVNGTTPTIKTQLDNTLKTNVTTTQSLIAGLQCGFSGGGSVSITAPTNYPTITVSNRTNSYACSVRTGGSTGNLEFLTGAPSSQALQAMLKLDGTFHSKSLVVNRVLISSSEQDIISSTTTSNDLSLLQGIYIDGNTPTVKVQLDSKVSSTDPSFTGTITLNKTLGKKLILYEGAVGPPNAHQYIGTSVESSTTTYHVEKSTVDHLFVSGISAVLSKELLRVKGTGKINIPDLTAGRVLTTDVTTNDLTSSSIKNSELETLSGSTGNIQASLINATYLMPCIRGTIKVRVVNGVLQPATVIYETAQVGYTLGTPVADTSKLTVVFSSSPLMTYIPYVSIQHVGYSYNRFNIEMVTTNYFVIRQINNSGNIQSWATSGATEEWFFDVEITKKPNP